MRVQAEILSGYDARAMKPDRARPFQDIADRLRAVRELSQMDQRTFALAAGLNYTQYKNWESGAYRIGVDGALKLQSKFGLSLDFIYTGQVDALPMNLRNAFLSKPADR